MSLRDDVASFSAIRGARCFVGTFLDSLDEDMRTEVEDAMADRALTSASFARWAQKRYGANVRDQSWARHRAGECACGRR